MNDIMQLQAGIRQAETDLDAALLALRDGGDLQAVASAQSRLDALTAASRRCATLALTAYENGGNEEELTRIFTFGAPAVQQAAKRVQDARRSREAKADYERMRREEAARQAEAESELRRQDEAIRIREAEERKRNTVQHLPEAPEASTAQRSARHVNPIGLQPPPGV